MTPQPEFELIAGHHRLEAFIILGRTEIPAVVLHLTDAEAARALTVENTNRSGLGDWEKYKHMVMLREVGAARNNTELARLLNVSRTAIAALDAFTLLPQAAKDLLDDHPGLIGYNLASDLRNYSISQPTLVFDALDKLAKKEIKEKRLVIEWIERQLNRRPKPAGRKQFELEGGARLVVSKDGARISGDIDYDRLHKLIEENLHLLLKEPAPEPAGETHQK